MYLSVVAHHGAGGVFQCVKTCNVLLWADLMVSSAALTEVSSHELCSEDRRDGGISAAAALELSVFYLHACSARFFLLQSYHKITFL